MLPRLIRCLSFSMLTLLLAAPAIAHAAPESDSTNCSHDRDTGSSRTLDRPQFAPDPTDANNASHFAATRALSTTSAAPSANAAHIAICGASLTVTPSPDASAHLSISLSKPLPSGQLASSLVRRFALTGSHLDLEIEAPEGLAPRIALTLPSGTRTELALIRGDLDLRHLLGDSQIAIVKGNATLHVADSDFSSLECATIMGGIHDRRPGGSSHGHVLSTWTAHGTGSAKIEFSAVSGDLILLPPSS